MLARALSLGLCLLAGPAPGEPIRFATYHTELSRDGPGLLLSDILKRDEQVVAVAEVIAASAPDVLVMADFDHDLEGHALSAFRALLAEMGQDYPFAHATRPNTGVPAKVDLDGNGYADGARDNLGYGRFTGQGGLAVLSKHPFGTVRDFSGFLWADLPGHMAPMTRDGPFPSAEAHAVRVLSSVAHWAIPVTVGARTIELLAWHGSSPVFDGPEDLNGRRGADELRFWRMLLDGALPFEAPRRPVVLAGVANIDPVDGDGRHEVMQSLLDDPRLTDPTPTSPGGTRAANAAHAGNPALDTADFDDPSPGNLRVDYVLPDAGLKVVRSGVVWPLPDDPMAAVVEAASRHRLVWVDVIFP